MKLLKDKQLAPIVCSCYISLGVMVNPEFSKISEQLKLFQDQMSLVSERVNQVFQSFKPALELLSKHMDPRETLELIIDIYPPRISLQI